MTDFDTSLLFEKAHDVESAKQMYYTSKKKLQVDYIDYYLLKKIYTFTLLHTVKNL